MSLTIQEVEHLAKLSKLKLSSEEKEKYRRELSAILKYVEKLQQVEVPKESQEAPVSDSRLRDDEVIGVSSQEQDELLKLVPEKEERLIKTRAVFK